MSIEAMKLARSVISSINQGKQHAFIVNDETVFWQREEWVRWALDEVLPAIDQAIEQAEQVQPVAWMSSGAARMIHWTAKHPGFGDDWIPLYTAPPASKPWVGLTDEEWQDLSDRYGLIIFGRFKNEIENKLKQKNEGQSPRQPLTDEQEEILNFLLGASDIDDVWFGDRHPKEKGQFWWRNKLRKAFQEAAHGIKENT